MYKHVWATWFTANLLHPFVILILFGYGSGLQFGNIIHVVFEFIAFSFIFSLPSLVFGFLAMYITYLLPAPAIGKYAAWSVMALSILSINMGIVAMLLSFAEVSEEKEIGLFLPAFVAVILALILQYNAFFRMVDNLNNKQNERDMV